MVQSKQRKDGRNFQFYVIVELDAVLKVKLIHGGQKKKVKQQLIAEN